MSHKLLSFLTFITWFGQSRKLQCYGKNISTVTSDYEESGTTNAPVSSPLKKLVEIVFHLGKESFPPKSLTSFQNILVFATRNVHFAQLARFDICYRSY